LVGVATHHDFIKKRNEVTPHSFPIVI